MEVALRTTTRAGSAATRLSAPGRCRPLLVPRPTLQEVDRLAQQCANKGVSVLINK